MSFKEVLIVRDKWEVEKPLKFVNWLLRLPTVTTMECRGVAMKFGHCDGQGLNSEPFSPMLEHLVMQDCTFSDKALYEGLRGPKSLRSLVCRGSKNYSDSFDPFLIRAGLLTHARQFLET